MSFVNINAIADGQEGNLYLRSLNISTDQGGLSIPADALINIQRPILSIWKIDAQSQRINGQLILNVSIALDKPPPFPGDWKTHRVHFVFKDGKFQERYTTADEERVLDTWFP